MKYLKLYEAFKSKGISSTLKFLKDKVGTKSSDSFISTLRDFMTNVDYPIDQISDENIKYLNAKKALLLKNDKDVTNSKGIWVLKFWFSLQDGFLGTTATGNQRRDRNQSYSTNHGFRDTQKFNESDMDHIKENITTTGEIWPVTNYYELKTGDTVIGQFDSSSRRSITLAKIYVDKLDNNRTYAIQNVSQGSTPDGSAWRNYTQYGDLSWWLFDNDEMGDDHRKLHFWRPSDQEIHYIEPPAKNEDEAQPEEEKDPFEWNLPLSNRYSFSNWGRGSSMTTSVLEKADFALVLYFDDLINPESDAPYFEKPSETKQQRRSEKEGATKLMTDAEIKKMNIERYIQKLVVSLKITETEFFELEKIVNKHLAQEFSYFSIYLQRPDWSDISIFIDYLYNVADADDSDKTYYVNRIKDQYKSRTKNYYEQLVKFQETKKFIKGDSKLKKIYDELFKLGLEINQTLTKKKINSIDELWLLRTKIKSVYDFIKMSRNVLDYKVRECMSGFRYPEEMEHYYNQYKDQYSDDDYKKDLEKINRIRTFLKSI
jgi:hypothetical protein